LPDELPRLLEISGRAPSWKAIAVALLKNDWYLHSLGFSKKNSEQAWSIKREHEKQNSPQRMLI